MLGSGPFPETIVSPVDGAEMVYVPPGEFTRGITEEELAHIFLLAHIPVGQDRKSYICH
jgi:hypothetical protein